MSGSTTHDARTLDSLRRRMVAMHSLYDDALATMDESHVNHQEKDGVLPIAFSLFHYANMHDASFMLLTGQPPIWSDEWQGRVQPAIADHGKHRTVDEMTAQRIGDLGAFRDYIRAVFDRTEAWLTTLTPSDLDRIVIPRPFPPQIASTFSARVANDDGISLLDGIECWLYQHGLRHMGEIELARSFVGLQGMTS
ncbi:MAG: DinB family protein [Ilumatobacteraceae bacterium]|jgi:hypothetical protein|nr:hypothetical protein [Acidimicrobiia bacterium]